MNLLIVGAGGHGRCCYEIAERMECFDKIDFVDDTVEETLHKNIIGKFSDLNMLRKKYDCAFIAIGNNKRRKELYSVLKLYKFKRVNLFDPSAIISSYSKLGKGIAVFPNAVIEASATLEDGVVISSNTTIHHDVVIQEFSLVYAQCVIRPAMKVHPLTTIQSGTIIYGGN